MYNILDKSEKVDFSMEGKKQQTNNDGFVRSNPHAHANKTRPQFLELTVTSRGEMREIQSIVSAR